VTPHAKFSSISFRYFLTFDCIGLFFRLLAKSISSHLSLCISLFIPPKICQGISITHFTLLYDEIHSPKNGGSIFAPFLLKVENSSLQVWFQNRRAKFRRNERSMKGSTSPYHTNNGNNNQQVSNSGGMISTSRVTSRALSPMSMSINLAQRRQSSPSSLLPSSSQFAPPNVVVQNSVFPPQGVNNYGSLISPSSTALYPPCTISPVEDNSSNHSSNSNSNSAVNNNNSNNNAAVNTFYTLYRNAATAAAMVHGHQQGHHPHHHMGHNPYASAASTHHHHHHQQIQQVLNHSYPNYSNYHHPNGGGMAMPIFDRDWIASFGHDN
jgi:hypothetical protein